MLIQYCESCGTRVSEAEFNNGALQIQDKAYCPRCAVGVPRQRKPPTGSTQISPRTPEKGTSNTRLAAIKPATGRAAPVHAPKSAHAAHKQAGGGAPVLAIAGIVGVLLVGGFVFANKAKPAAQRDTPEKKSPPDTSVKKQAPAVAAQPPATATPQTLPAPTTQVDPKEEYARKRWTEIQSNEKKLTPYHARKEVENFVSIYGSHTIAGKEAVSYLAKMPKVDPPPPLASTVMHAVLWSSDFEADNNGITKGKRSTDNSFGGVGYSVKSDTNDSDFFTSMIGLNFQNNGGEPVNITEDTWIRFACRIEGSNTICFHTSIGDGVYEKYVKTLTPDKWQWVTFKMSDYTANFKNRSNPIPVPGALFRSTAIFGTKKNGATTVYIDQFSINSGPIPPEPK